MAIPTWWNDLVRTIGGQLTGDFPGAAFGVETRADGRLMASVGQGWSKNSICEIGSMTKPFTATAVLLVLKNLGMLNVDAFVHTLPGMGIWANLPDGDPRKQIRVRHLLQHTSGLPYFNDLGAGAPLPCEGAPRTTGGIVRWTGSPGLTNECILADGQWQPARQVGLFKIGAYVMNTYMPLRAPGMKSTYSNFDYLVAARIVEASTGKSINRYIYEKIFHPLGMTDSFFIAQPTGNPAVDAKINDNVTDRQRARIKDVTVITEDHSLPPEVAPGPEGVWDKFRRNWLFVWPEGGMYSTVPNLLTFLRMLRNGGLYQGRRILPPAIVDLLLNDQGFEHTMGFGYVPSPNMDGQGTGTVVHEGRFMTYFWYDPGVGVPGARVLGVFLSQRLTQRLDANREYGEAIIHKFVKLVNGKPLT